MLNAQHRRRRAANLDLLQEGQAALHANLPQGDNYSINRLLNRRQAPRRLLQQQQVRAIFLFVSAAL